MVFRRRVVPHSPCLLLALLLTGCGTTAINTRSNPINNSHASGTVHGGQQPVAGAAIQLYTVGTTADGSAATPLLTSTVTSGSDGSFTITGLYSCTNATQVYIVATGGNPGLSTTNPNIALMAALGPCSSLTSSTFININELTTVAAVSALAPFMASPSAIGSSSSDATLLTNAFTLANEYVNIATGLSPGANVPVGYTVPTTELNTLADILSACINSTGGTAGDGSLCGQLFTLTTVSPNPAPTNTIQAMVNLVYNPGLNTSALYALTPPTPPFQPTLTSAPANFLVTLQSAAPYDSDTSAVNFLNVTVGSNSTIQTINLQSYSGYKVIGANASDFIVGLFVPTYSGSCVYPGAPAPNGPCWIQVYARPSATGLRTAALEIDYNYGTSSIYIPLSVTGVPPPGSNLSNSFVNFPPTIAGTSSTPAPITLSNSGPGTLTVSSVAISGATNNNFTQTNNCSSVAANASCSVYITFAPSSSGTQSATLQITSNATGSGSVSLSGTGVALGSAPSLWPSSMTFTIWGASEDLTLINPGTTSIAGNVTVATTGGLQQDHRYSGSGCGTVAAGTSCTMSITNVPVHPLSFYSSGFSSVTGQAFLLNPSLLSNITTQNYGYLTQNGTFGASGISFPDQQVGQSETDTIQLANIPPPPGSPNQNGSGSPAASLAIGGANPGDFSVSAVQPTVSSTPSPFCPAASTGTQPCTITIAFKPTATGTRSAVISLDANGSGTGQYFTVTGTGIGPGPSFDVSSATFTNHLPSSIDPASTTQGTVVVRNNGTTTLTLAAAFTGSNPSSFTADVSQCQSLAPQATCNIPVTLTATTVGGYSATLGLTDTSSNTTVTSSVSGTLAYWLPTVFSSTSITGPPPVAISFPTTQAVNTTSSPQNFTVADQNQYPIGDPITVSLQANSNFVLPASSTCPSGSQPCTLSIEFAPHTTGSFFETLTLTDPVTGASSSAVIYGFSQ